MLIDLAAINQYFSTMQRAKGGSPFLHLETQQGKLVLRKTSRGNQPGVIYVTLREHEYGDTWYATIRKNNTIQYNRNLERLPWIEYLLEDFSCDIEAYAKTYGKTSGVCCICNWRMHDSAALIHGYHDTCADVIGWSFDSNALFKRLTA